MILEPYESETERNPISEEEECYQRLLSAGGVLPAGRDSTLEDDFWVATIQQVAKLVVIEGQLYWKLQVPNENELLMLGTDQ